MDENSFIGQEIGNYRIVAEINSGAYGSIYKAEHTHLTGRFVAIKLLHTYMGSTKEREQFAQEARFLALLEHPHILSVLDFGFRERQPYLIVGYAAGGSLRDLLERQVVLPLDNILTVLAQIGQALHYAHQRNIIHRDLKPENILFSAQGSVLLADFGIAVMLFTASVKHLATVGGTPPYMAPEQFRGIISKESDQYALGCIAYELMTGHMPFDAPDFLSMGFKHLTEPPPALSYYNPQVPPTIEEAILKALAKQRSQRHADIPAFITALQMPFKRTTTRKIAPTPSVRQPIVLRVPSITHVASTSGSPARTKEAWLVTGNEHYDASRDAEALAAYDQAILLDPNYALAYNAKGTALDGLKRYQEALLAYDQAIRADPNYALAYYNKGNTLLELKQYVAALAATEQAIRLDPNYALAYYNKGIALRKLDKPKEARQAYEKARQLENNH